MCKYSTVLLKYCQCIKMIVALHMSHTVLCLCWIPTHNTALLSIVVPDLWPLNSVWSGALFFYVYCMCVLHSILYRALTQNVKHFWASLLKRIDVVHIMCFISKHSPQPESCQTSWGRTWNLRWALIQLGVGQSHGPSETSPDSWSQENWRSNCILLWILWNE